MGIESMNRVSSSYQEQGSSVKTASVQAAPQVEAPELRSSAPSKDIVDIASTAARENGETRSPREQGQASNEQIRQAVEKINKEAQYNGEAVFGIHDETNRVTIKIVDKTTKEVIKEFPPEKTLDMIAKVWEMAGIMVDERR